MSYAGPNLAAAKLGPQQDSAAAVSPRLAEISVKGQWRSVPVLDHFGKSIFVKGTWLRMAQVVDEEWLESELQDPDLCASRLQEPGGLQADILTFTQKLPGTMPRYDHYFEWESVAAVSTNDFAHWWATLPRQSRQNIRRAEQRGVKIVVKSLDDELVRGIMDVNNECPIRQGVPNRHYGKTFEEVQKDHLAMGDRADFVCAYSGQELIGFVWLIYRGNIASILQILTKASAQDKRPANALIAKTVELCAEKGLSYLTYGLYNYGNKKHNSLREFKERNGFVEVRVPRYYIPLTAWGKLCMKIQLHRGLIGILPHSAIMAGLRIRSLLVKHAT